ncbi:unnamed protein product [Sphenostylis stenocarpa]|uniref:Uncharacterized protein n=1 Tax=Sphenostylis stenocarpa TaxID=92480 RepID=A0AA86SAW6_9FABA|nr:unnamed protein product [Sphenostylis stenocarpa]
MATGKPKKNQVLKLMGLAPGTRLFHIPTNMRFTPVPVRVLIPPMGVAYTTVRTTALLNLFTTSDCSCTAGSRCRIPVATGIIITAAATLCIHMLTKNVVAHRPSSSSLGFSGSPQNTDVTCSRVRSFPYIVPRKH